MDKSNQIKSYLRETRQEEMRRFSPKANSSNLDTRSISIPLANSANVFTKTSQLNNNLPPAGVLISPFRKNSRPQPHYDDFMNSIFSNKTHKSYILREKADLRSQVLEPKFRNSLNQQVDEQRIIADYERQLIKDSKNLEERRNRKVSLAQQAKEFQIKQMNDKRQYRFEQKSLEKREADTDIKKYQNLHQKEQTDLEVYMKKLKDNQNDLFRQMEERQQRNIMDETMNKTDFKLNTRMINELTQDPKLPPMAHRKPF